MNRNRPIRPGSLRSVWRGLANRPFVVFSLLLVAFAVWIVLEKIDASVAIGAVALMALAAVFLVLSRDDLVRLIHRLQKVGPVGFNATDASVAAAGLDQDGAELSEEDNAISFAETKIGLRLELEMKMSSLAKRVFGEPSGPSMLHGKIGYVTVGGLYDNGYLTREQAKLAASILTWKDDKPLSSEDGELAADVKTFVDKFRIIVFAETIEDLVKETRIRLPTEVSPNPPKFGAAKVGREGERDIEVYTARAARIIRLIPAFTMRKSSSVVRRISDRLEDDEQDPSACWIVVPNGSPTEAEEGGPPVVQFKEINRDWLLGNLGLK